MNVNRKTVFLISAFMSIIVILSGCSAQSSALTDDATLIYEETVSPNAAYTTSDDDIVNYYIKVYQDNDFTIVVDADSNSPLLEEQQYTINYDKQIAKEDVSVRWSTLMGNPEATEDDQLAIAKVAISADGKIFSERNINFAKNAIEVVVDTINKNN